MRSRKVRITEQKSQETVKEQTQKHIMTTNRIERINCSEQQIF